MLYNRRVLHKLHTASLVIHLTSKTTIHSQHGLIIPVPKLSDKESDPSNHPSIIFLSVIAKVFEKVILLHLEVAGVVTSYIHSPRKVQTWCKLSSHTSYIFEEAIQCLRDQKKKAYVILLDVQKRL